MSTYVYSGLIDGQTIPFDPLTDLLYFDLVGTSAADLTVSPLNATTLKIEAAGKTIYLSGLTLETIDSWNLMFSDGSRLIVGNDSAYTSGYDPYTGYIDPFFVPDDAGNVLIGGDLNDQLLGLGGGDTLNGGLGNDVLNGGDGFDTASYADATVGVTVNLGLTGPQSTGGAGLDSLISIENLIGSELGDRLIGDVNSNIIQGLGGNDTINGGDGVDTASYADAGAAVSVNLGLVGAQNTLGAGLDTLTSIEDLRGSAFNDTLTGNALANRIDGALGGDTMAGGAGNDTYIVDSALDQTIEALGGGTDTVIASRSWTLGANIENLTLASSSFVVSYGEVYYIDANLNATGNALNNLIQGNGGDNVLLGGTGIDIVSYAGSHKGVNVNLAFTSAQNTGWGRDTLRGFENLTGSAFNDRLLGNAGANTLKGGAGDDLLVGGGGNDILFGETGNDTAAYFNAGAGVTVNLGLTGAQNTVGAGSDTLSAIENVQGSAYNDKLTGNDLNNVLEGLVGDDVLAGGAGIDTVSYAGAGTGVTVSLALTTAQNTIGAGIDTLTTFENLLGSGFNDTLTGNTLANRIDGASGGDTMAGGAGNDTYLVDTFGGMRLTTVNGSQTLVSWAGPSDSVVELAGEGNDTVQTHVSFVLPGNVENLVALELAGTSYVYQPPLTLTGNGLDNLIVDNRGSNRIDGGAGIDTVSFQYASSSVNVLLGSYNSSASGGNGYDQLANIENVIGSAFNDQVTVDGMGNKYNGGAGIDTLSYGNIPSSGYPNYTTPGVSVSLALTGPQNTIGAGTDTILNFENLVGGGGNDTLGGSASDNILIGGNGDDILQGVGGNDILIGGHDPADWWGPTDGIDTGNDTASYASAAAAVTVDLGLTGAQNTLGAGTDVLIGIENLMGSAFNDRLSGDGGDNILSGLAGADTLTGGAGRDRADYAAAGAAVNVNLALGSASGGAGNDTLTGIEDLAGSAFNDVLSGDANGNLLQGVAGNDTLNGGDGIDTLLGGTGDDLLNGGTGADLASYADAAGGVTVSLALTGAQSTLSAGTDTLTGVEGLLGSAFNDTLTGNDLANTIDGGLGDDTLSGGLGIDTLSYASVTGTYGYLSVNLASGFVFGSGGTDTISGFENLIGSGGSDNLSGNGLANVLTGGGGNDYLFGDAGADAFKFVTTGDGVDNITDFTSATDKIRVVSSNFANLPVGLLDPSRLVAAGTPLLTGDAVFLYDATTGALSFDSDGNGGGAAVQIASLTGPKTLVASDIQVVAA